MAKEDDERVVPPDVVYNIFIRTSPQKVWDALTRSAFTTQYFFVNVEPFLRMVRK